MEEVNLSVVLYLLRLLLPHHFWLWYHFLIPTVRALFKSKTHSLSRYNYVYVESWHEKEKKLYSWAMINCVITRLNSCLSTNWAVITNVLAYQLTALTLLCLQSQLKLDCLHNAKKIVLNSASNMNSTLPT